MEMSEGRWRPLSERMSGKPDSPLKEGVPPSLMRSIIDWVTPKLTNEPEFLQDLRPENEVVLMRIERCFDMSWPNINGSRLYPLLDMMKRDQELALNVVEFLLGEYSSQDSAEYLKEMLFEANSAWTVDHYSHPPRLMRRLPGAVQTTIEGVISTSDRAGLLLKEAYVAIFGRQPDSTKGYRESIRAVEAIAQPIIAPDDPIATLGKMIILLKDKPSKWKVDLSPQQHGKEPPPDPVLVLRDMMAVIWKSQFDRHGTPDKTIPLNVSLEEAESAFHLSVALVGMFSRERIRRIPT